MKHLVVLTGAGMSAESGIRTFRDHDGLWENYPVQEVASIEGWYKNPELMLRFYNERRLQLRDASPNEGHKTLARLENIFNIQIITQNIDDLHERAGSNHVLHLHGELTKARSEKNDNLIVDIGYNPIRPGDKASDGARLRPHIVWFGEAVPNIGPAAQMVEEADILLIIGTSLVVYPAAGLIHYARPDIPVYLVDPHPAITSNNKIHIIADKAVAGLTRFEEIIAKSYQE